MSLIIYLVLDSIYEERDSIINIKGLCKNEAQIWNVISLRPTDLLQNFNFKIVKLFNQEINDLE